MKADHAAVTRLLKTARGQLDGILAMVEEDRYCVDVSNQIMATQSILNRANREILKAHVGCCVREAVEHAAAGDENSMEQKLAEVQQLMDKLGK